MRVAKSAGTRTERDAERQPSDLLSLSRWGRADSSRMIVPKSQHPKPPFPRQQQPMPGYIDKMRPRPDHGEEATVAPASSPRAVITGADSGIGGPSPSPREGADVLISYLNEHEDAEETRRLVEEAGRKAVLVPGRYRIACALPRDRRKGYFGTRRHRPSRQ